MAGKPSSQHRLPFYAVDLHVHTPASSCYKGPRTDDEYLNILKRYSEKGVRIIAVTDHNTLKGYKRYIEIKNRLVATKAALEVFSGNVEVDKILEGIESDLQVFSEILILPGVELEVRPGIHLLFVFNPANDLKAIDDFIEKAGYHEEMQGCDNPDILPNYDVIDALENYTNLDGIAIAAHIDSHKGIHKELKGNYRAAIFRSSELTGITYNNPATADIISGLLGNTEYKRSEPLAFLQASDYHGGDEVGSRLTYFRLDSIDYDSLKSAFRRPAEYISPTQHPEEVSIIKKVIAEPNTMVFEKLELDKLENVKSAACALLNEGYGSLVIGVSATGSFIGVNGSQKEHCKLIDSFLDDIEPEFDFDITFYPLGGKRHIIVIRLSALLKAIYSIGGSSVYLLRDNHARLASAIEVQAHVETMLFKRLQSYSTSHQARIEFLLRELKTQVLLSTLYDLAHTIERNSYRLKDIAEFEIVTPRRDDSVIASFKGNGEAHGNAVVVERTAPHLPGAYLRSSSPQVFVETIPGLRFEGERILLVNGGATYLKTGTGKWDVFASGVEVDPVILLQLKPAFRDRFSAGALVLWLKSTICLWLSLVKTGTTNIYLPSAFMELIVPALPLFDKDGWLNIMGQRIYDLEMEFLQREDLVDYVDAHNAIVNQKAYEVDLYLCNKLGIRESEKGKITSCFQQRKMFIPLSMGSPPKGDETGLREAATNLSLT